MIKENSINSSTNSSFNTDGQNPEILKLREENPFVVPENYFDDLPNTIMEKIHSNYAKRSRSISLYIQKLKPAYYLAASLVILIAITVFILRTERFDANRDMVALSWDEIAGDDYFVYSDFNIYNIIDALVYSNEIIDYHLLSVSIDLSTDVYTEEDSAENSDAIIEYLIDEDFVADYILDL